MAILIANLLGAIAYLLTIAGLIWLGLNLETDALIGFVVGALVVERFYYLKTKDALGKDAAEDIFN